MNLWDTLPAELRIKILTMRMRDLHAAKIQRAFLCWSLCSHRKQRAWDELKTHIGKERKAFLEKFCNVRREWRSESENWLGTVGETLDEICYEAKLGLWGTRTTRSLEEEHEC